MSDHREKLAWARQHLVVINKTFWTFLEDQDVCSLVVEHDAKERHYRVSVRVIKNIPGEWGMMVGDTVHNLRSSLDAITYAVVAKYAPALTLDEIKQIQFLVVDWPADWKKCIAHGQRKRWHPRLVAEMERLQPYFGGHGTGQHPLAAIRELSNIDKHRHIVTTLTTLDSIDLFFVPPNSPQVFRSLPFRGALVDGALIGVVQEIGDGVDPCVDMHNNIILDVAFGHGTPWSGMGARKLLWGIADHIEGVVFPALEPLLV